MKFGLCGNIMFGSGTRLKLVNTDVTQIKADYRGKM